MEKQQNNRNGESNIVVVVTPQQGQGVGMYLEVIGRKCVNHNIDEIALQCTFNNQGTAELLVNLLTKAFGWQEVERKRIRTKSRAGIEIDVLQIIVGQLGAIKGL